MRRSRLSRVKQNKLIEHFVAGTTARTVADLVGVNRKTAAYYFHRLRIIISRHLETQASEFLSGEIEVDESYFGGRRKGKRGRGAGGKIPVFGLLKRGGKVYTKDYCRCQRRNFDAAYTRESNPGQHCLFGQLARL